MVLEQVAEKPDWPAALEVALLRPPGVPERRSGEDPWQPRFDRPRRISDDLAWFRRAVDEPEEHGLRPVDETAAVTAWEDFNGAPLNHLKRLRDRGVLQAAGFELHEPDRAAA